MDLGSAVRVPGGWSQRPDYQGHVGGMSLEGKGKAPGSLENPCLGVLAEEMEQEGREERGEPGRDVGGGAAVFLSKLGNSQVTAASGERSGKVLIVELDPICGAIRERHLRRRSLTTLWMEGAELVKTDTGHQKHGKNCLTDKEVQTEAAVTGAGERTECLAVVGGVCLKRGVAGLTLREESL